MENAEAGRPTEAHGAGIRESGTQSVDQRGNYTAGAQKVKREQLQGLDPNFARLIEKLDRIIELLSVRTRS
jgi:hypothetical protein